MKIKDMIGKSKEEIREIVDQEWKDEIYSLPIGEQSLAIIKKMIQRFDEAQELIDSISRKEAERAARPWYRKLFS